MLAMETLLLLLVCGDLALALSSKPVHISLGSSWCHSPVVLEASEFISGEDPLLFWKFLEGTQDLSSATNERAVYESVLDQAEQLLPPLVFSCLQLALSLHSHSPALAMYQQLAEERRRSLGGGGDECWPWAESGGGVFCTLASLQSSLEQKTISHQADVYSFDHVFPDITGNMSSLPVVILYCQWGTEICAHWHSEMASLASQGAIQYVFRHHVQSVEDGGSPLSGYGVQLAVKNSEYKAIDDTQIKGAGSIEEEEDGAEVDTQGFVFSTLKSLHAGLSTQLEDFKLHLDHSAREIPELKAWQLQDLGFQAAQRVVSSPPDMSLSVLRDITQNLPTMARSLSRVAVKKELRSEVAANQRSLQQYGMEPGDSVVLFNGIVLQTGSTDAFSVLEVAMAESRLIGGLTGLGLSLSDSHSLVQIPVHSQVQSFSVDMRSESVVFINDLESDKEYGRWPKSLKQFLQPSFPGSLRQVARNAFNLVFCFDPASPEGLEMVEYVVLFLENLVPVRLGVLLVSKEEQEVSAALSRGFYYISRHHSRRRALHWLLQVQSNMSLAAATEVMDTEFPDAPEDVLEEMSTEEERQRKEAAEFYESKGFSSLPQVLLNGVLLDMGEDLESVIVSQLQQQTYLIQRWVYMKKMSDSTDVYQYFMERPNVMQRLNHHITAADCLQVDFSGSLPSPMPAELIELNSLSSLSMSALIAHGMVYYTSTGDEFAVRPVSVWVVADVSCGQGSQAALSAISYLAETSSVQIGLLHNPSTASPARLVQVIVAAELNGWTSVDLLLALLSSPDQALHTLSQHVSVNESVVTAAVDASLVDTTLSAHAFYSRRVLGLSGGQTALLTNGRLVGPLEEGEVFSQQDYAMLVQLENSSYAHSVAEAVGAMDVAGISPDDDTSSFRSCLAMKVSSLLHSQPQQHRIPNPTLKEKQSGVHLPAPEPLHHVITAILNPLDPSMQKWAHLLKVLQVVVPCDISVFLNPQSKLSEMPIRSFYRYVLEPELAFLPDGSLAPGPRATFSHLPHSPLLTLHMDVPHAWLVAAVHSPHDLDNIHLQSVENGVQAEFVLEHILVEGQLYDAGSGQPVPGLELVLGPPSQQDLYDTVVMANLGYFQLKANPGVWQLQIRGGRSRDIYTIAGHSGDGLWEKAEDRLSVAVRSFSGTVHIVRVEKRRGMEQVRLLYSDEEEAETEDMDDSKQGSVWDTLSSLMGGGKEEGKAEQTVSVNETINVFSIASGHLYERFLRIMMLSVLKHTQHPVKFWFLENYLSPTFKDFIPYMAEHYGFAYELVQYKWPRWLHQQSEKQRLIWGYKILFLDVLFPLSVKHIIFVDADQTVRADLAELLQVPLDGAPYGYTPFCNDRPEMDGFRFWERGYWKNHLGSRRYHISALYVVDLLRFRQLAAGDRLRGQYQALSQDPNSLSNLDQDLPNNMIHQVPIKSLPQEWLWCETWCSEASKASAKTIDLCNNPMTKEPKLTSAMRILPEWSVYDQEIRQLQEARAGHLTPAPPTGHQHSEL